MGTGAFLAHGHFGSSDAKFYGVELDSITGRISKQLYQKANIQVTGYENALLPDNYFDCVIGNVPFGNFQVNDPQYNRLHFPIHDYFFAKSIDKLRTGGIMAFITSSGTLDKKDDRARKYIAERCDLIGAVRLPKWTLLAMPGIAARIFPRRKAHPSWLPTAARFWSAAGTTATAIRCCWTTALDLADHN